MSDSDSLSPVGTSRNHENDYSDDEDIVPAKRAKREDCNEEQAEDCSRKAAAPANAEENAGTVQMDKWEAPFWEKLGKIAASKGGRVLQVGFGKGISAGKIQKEGVEEHVIVEEDHYKELEKWSSENKDKVTILKGVWQEVLADLQDESFDGILYHGCAKQASEFHNHQFFFISEQGRRLLKPGGVLTYANLPSWCEFLSTDKYDDVQKMFQETQVAKLVDIGFKEEQIKTDVVVVEPPKDCTYYTHHEIIAPNITK